MDNIKVINPLVRLLILWYTTIFISTEVLSFFHILSRGNILISEAIFLIIILTYLRRDIIYCVKSINFKSKTSKIITLILSLIFIQGIMSAPNTTDSMVYHLTKVMYWIQEKTVYQDIIRNGHDYKGPFGEYITLTLYFILGDDRIVFLSQWLAFFISIYLSGIIALQLGANRKIQNLVCLFIATLPIGVMEASSTQVDMVMTVIVMICLHISLLLVRNLNITNVILLGIAIGLGILTKAYFLIYLVIPFGILAYFFIKTPRKLLFIILPSLLIAILIQLRFIAQNIHLYGSITGTPLQSETELTYTNGIFSLGGFISNLTRHIMDLIPIPFFNTQVYEYIVEIHKLLGIGVNDPRTTFLSKFTVASVIYPQEDIVASTLHLMLILATIVYLIFGKISNDKKIAKVIFILAIISFLLFNAVFKWMISNIRIEIPFLMIGTLTSVLLVGQTIKAKKVFSILVVLSCILSMTIILLNVSRPYISYTLFYDYVKRFSQQRASIPEAFYIKPRMEQYFNARYYWYEPYDKIMDLLTIKKGYKEITLDLMDTFEYPLWVMLKNKGLDFLIVPKEIAINPEIIISTSEKSYVKDDYYTRCFKTSIEYGYACLSEKR